MFASKFLTSTVSALTIIGTAGVVYAQTATTDPAITAPADTTVQTTPAPDAALVAPSSGMSTIPAAPSDSPMTTQAEPLAQADRN